MLFTREKKYQFIKLMNTGLSLRDANAMARIVGVAQMKGYMNDGDRAILLAIIDKLERFSGLIQTRKQGKQKVVKKYSSQRGEDRIANFFAKGGFGINIDAPIDWRRRGVLRRRVMEKRAETRPGSSIGKIGRTRVIGHRKVNKDLDDLAKALNDMIRSFESIGDKQKASRLKTKAVSDAISSIKTSVSRGG